MLLCFCKYLGGVKKTLVDIEALHKKTFEKNGKLMGADFYAERRRLMKQRDNSLGPLVRKREGVGTSLGRFGDRLGEVIYEEVIDEK